MFRVLKGIVFFALFLFVFGFISMTLWNALIPDLFHGPILTYWQALGLLLFAKIFFGAKGGHHRGWHHKRKPWMKEWENDWQTYKGWQCWGREWEEKFARMTPEERDNWKRNLKDQWRSAKDKMERDSEQMKGDS